MVTLPVPYLAYTCTSSQIDHVEEDIEDVERFKKISDVLCIVDEISCVKFYEQGIAYAATARGPLQQRYTT